MKDLKYIAAYIVPLLTVLAISQRGWYSYLTVIVIFGIIPFLEMFTPQDQSNLSPEEADSKAKRIFFEILLYLNIPIVYAVLAFFLVTVSQVSLTSFELFGLIFSVGITLGANGINVAHELGHRDERFHKIMAKSLLLPAMYMHFIIEHNLGHHKNVATDEDPASARKGEPLYLFWIRSIVLSYRHAWEIQKQILTKNGKSFFSMSNEMLLFAFLQIGLLGAVSFVFGLTVMTYFLMVSLVAVLLLETINYVEHYGLRRQKINNRYERVRPIHSWNSNHEVGRILLYELTRHSDHHFIANKKYQILDHHDESKQLPLGYPGSMLLSMLPPLWFKVMDHRIETV